MTHLMCCFGYMSNCGCRNFVIDKYAFYPPVPSYSFQIINQKEQNDQFNKIITQYKLFVKEKKKNNKGKQQLEYAYDPSEIQLYPDIISNDQGFDIALLLIEYQQIIQSSDNSYNQEQQQQQQQSQNNSQLKQQNKYLLLFSHGNATDIGQNIDCLIELCIQTKIDILVYDYSGYGVSTGNPSDITIIKDITSVYKYAVSVLGYKWNNIILYGQSLGSGPSIYLASRVEYPILGLIVHSAYTSGLRITLKREQAMGKTHKQDFFPNIDLIQYINAPIFIIHGTNDNIIPFSHAMDLYSKTKKQYEPWYVQNANHNNIEHSNKFKGDYYAQVKKFVKTLIKRDQQTITKQLHKEFRASRWGEEFDHFYKYLNPPVYIKDSISSIIEMSQNPDVQTNKMSGSIGTTNQQLSVKFNNNKSQQEYLQFNKFNSQYIKEQDLSQQNELSEKQQSDQLNQTSFKTFKSKEQFQRSRTEQDDSQFLGLQQYRKLDSTNLDRDSGLTLDSNQNIIYKDSSSNTNQLQKQQKYN